MSKDQKAQDETARNKMEELAEEEEEIKRISQLNPPSGCGRDEDRFTSK